jgi:tetratricopeptide (TPR) repeat protein
VDSYTQGLRLRRDPRLLVQRGWEYLRQGAANLAAADFDEAIRLRPGHGEAYFGRADARVRQGQLREAALDVEKGVSLGPAGRRLLFSAARVHAQVSARLASERPSDKALAARSRRRAVELLGQALERVPAGERAAFWKDYVEADSALTGIRGDPALRKWTAR